MSTSEPVRFAEFLFDGDFGEGTLQIKGSVATFKGLCPDLQTLGGLIGAIIDRFPSSFACASVTPVSISALSGTAHLTPFSVRLKDETDLSGLFFPSEPVHERLTKYFKEIFPSALAWPVQIVSATRYLSQSFLLESVSKHSYYFVGERILNVCKAIESITAQKGENVDHTKEFLRRWSVHPRFIEIFASVIYLRHKLDVAHIANGPISPEAFQKLNSFLPIAEMCTQRLILTAIRRFNLNPQVFDKIETKPGDPDVIKKLAQFQKLYFTDDGGLSELGTEDGTGVRMAVRFR